MSSWSKNRKLLYGGIVAFVLVAAIVIPTFLYFYKPPTCFDGIKNGSEQGIDCGGKCERLCQSAFLPPQVAWSRFEELAPGLYNVAAYIVNPNTNGKATDIPYHISLFDSKGVLITEVAGTVDIQPQRNALAFKEAVSVGKRVPERALFEFYAAPDWNKANDLLSALSVQDKEYREDSLGSSLSVTLRNGSVNPIPKMNVYAVLYDGSGNAIGFSKTVIDGIKGQSTAFAPFTWPTNRQGRVVSIDILPVAE